MLAAQRGRSGAPRLQSEQEGLAMSWFGYSRPSGPR
jgi:hypothetical protein